MTILVKSWGQEGNCGTPQNTPNNNPTYQLLSTLQDACPIFVNVKFHIVNYANGTGNISVTDVNSMLNTLNTAYNVHKIFFNNIGTDIINNDNLANFSNTKFNTLAATNRVTNAINVYIVPTTNGEYRGRAEDIPSIALVIDKAYYNLSTLPHEMGHCLNLFHTHHGVELGGCAENINGSNCSICGDYICDTPADPGLSGLVNSSCVYIGGMGYNPDTRNIMSYSNIGCRDRFSIKQGERMYGSLKSISILQAAVGQSSYAIIGNNAICTSTASSYSLANILAGTTVTWSVTPTGIVSLSNTTGSSITLTKIGNGIINLNATVTSSCNSTLIVSKSIAVGNYNINASVIGTASVYPNTPYTYTLKTPSGANISNIYWGIPHNWIKYSGGQGTNQIVVITGTTGGTVEASFNYGDCNNSATVGLSTYIGGGGGNMMRPSITQSPIIQDVKIITQKHTQVVKLKNSVEDILQVKIIDPIGRILKTQSFEKGVKYISLSPPNLVSGTYILQIFNGQEWNSQPIIVD